MKIVDVRTCTLRGNFEWNYVKLTTDEAVSGIGEAYWGVGVRNVMQEVAETLIGQDPLDVERLTYGLFRRFSASGSGGGTVVTAISGIEIALWDLAGKIVGVPVYQLMGGKFRDRVRLYLDSGHARPMTTEGYATLADQASNLGFTAVKFDIDSPSGQGRDQWGRMLSNREISEMVSWVEAVRETLGPDMAVAIDLHWQYNVADAIKVARELEPYKLMWLEDPVPPENVEAMRRVSDSTSTPICTGENLYTRYQLSELILKNACAYVAPDIPKMGGLGEARRLADLAEMHYMAIAPHNVSSPLATVAAAHACATLPNFLVMEFHSQEVAWWDDLVKGDQPVIVDGHVPVPGGPGIGIELDEEVMQEHCIAGHDFFSQP